MAMEAKMNTLAGNKEPAAASAPAAVKTEDNEFLMYSGNSLGEQLRDYDQTPSLFTVILDHLVPGFKDKK